MYFDLIHTNLRSLSLQTELLEACNWNEDELKDVMEKVALYLNSLDLKSGITWNKLSLDIKKYLSNNFNKQITTIIINTIDSKKNEFQKLMELPEQ